MDNYKDIKYLNAEEKLKLINKITYDNRFLAHDVKVYIFLLNHPSGFVQEDIADFLNLQRRNVNRSVVKLQAFNYLRKKKQAETNMTYYIPISYEDAGIVPVTPYFIGKMCNTGKTKTKDKLHIDYEQDSETQDSDRMLIKSIFKNIKYEFNDEVVKSNPDLQLLFFLLLADDERIQEFSRVYLEGFMDFYKRHLEIRDELFYKTYYSERKGIISEKGLTISEMMKLCDVRGRDIPHSRELFYKNLESKSKYLIKKYDALLNTGKFQDLIPINIVKNILETVEYEKNYSLVEGLILLAISDKFDDFKEDKCLSLFKYCSVFYPELESELVPELKAIESFHRYARLIKLNAVSKLSSEELSILIKELKPE